MIVSFLNNIFGPLVGLQNFELLVCILLALILIWSSFRG